MSRDILKTVAATMVLVLRGRKGTSIVTMARRQVEVRMRFSWSSEQARMGSLVCQFCGQKEVR
jgi:hypothetical protein